MRPLTAALTAALLLPAAAAQAAPIADQPIAELGRDGPVAGFGGWTAWSAYEGGRYALMLREPDGPARRAPLSSSARPFDVSLGPASHNRLMAIYQRCAGADCDIRRMDVRTGAEQTLRSVSSPSFDEAAPSIWRSRVAFTRRIRGCDVPYVKDLRSSRPSRRLLHTKCLQTGPANTSIRGTRILVSSVDLAGADKFGAGRKVSEIRRYSARTRGSDVLIRQGFGEESNLFGQVAQEGRNAYTVRFGCCRANTFVRIPFDGGRPQEVRAHRALTGAFARPSNLVSLFVEYQEDYDSGCEGFTDVPCRVVLAPANIFGEGQRALTPRMTVGYEGEPRRGQPLAFSGKLTRTVVVGGSVVRTEPLGGVSVDLRHREGDRPETFRPTGLAAPTGADGTYRVVLPAVGDDPWYTAVAATPGVPTWAGRGTVGSVAP